MRTPIVPIDVQMADADTSMNANQSANSNSSESLNAFDTEHLPNENKEQGDYIAPAVDNEMKQCPDCTLYNAIDNLTCDVCDFTFP